MEKIDLMDFAQRLNLEIKTRGRGWFKSYTSDIHRPAVQFTGYFDHFAYERVQMFGNQEMGYIDTLPEETLHERLVQFFDYELPVIIVCNGYLLPNGLLDLAITHGVPVLTTELSSSKTVNKVVDYLDIILAEETTLHANVLEVHNAGVMLRGESGVGKSELTLELIMRGHIMVSDDFTILRKVSDNRLIAYAQESTRHLMEIRGVGIMDIKQMYGMKSVLDRKSLDIIIDMQMWDADTDYDRLGFDIEYETVMGVKVPRYVMPVRQGRNLATIVEATAMSHKLKRSGFSIEDELERRLAPMFEMRSE